MKDVRTTVILDEKILKKTKQLAKEESTTLKNIIEMALVEFINKPKKPSPTKFKLELVTLKGSPTLGLELIDDRDTLYDLMDQK